MRILVVGGGGREHALAHQLRLSRCVPEIFIAPGNAGTAEIGTNVPIQPENVFGLLAFAREKKIDLTVVGPETALAAGIVDTFQGAGLKIFGPTRLAAKIETSKVFCRSLLREAGVPVPNSVAASTLQEVDASINSHDFAKPVVVKADGPAGGKGVKVCHSAREAKQYAVQYLEHHPAVLFEEFLEGVEVSIHAFVDSNGTVKMFPPAQDHKQLYAGGPNTGGMGAIAPVPLTLLSAQMMEEIERTMVIPIVRALAASYAPFMGCIYPGLMLTAEGPKVLEINARFGDPETQVYMRLFESDLVEILMACIDGCLDTCDLSWSEEEYAACVVVAAEGYPLQQPTAAMPIRGLLNVERRTNAVIFHAGTEQRDRAVVATGGRTLGVTARSMYLDAAVHEAYDAVHRIHFFGMQFRPDIGAAFASSVGRLP